MRVRKGVIPAAGLGTRFLPATKAMPKEMLTVVDRPAIQYVVEEAVAAGVHDLLVVTRHGRDSLQDHFDRAWELEHRLSAAGKQQAAETVRALAQMADIHFIRQAAPLGLGHAVGLAAAHVGDEPFAVLLPDDLVVDDGELLARMAAVQERTGGGVVAVCELPPEEVSSYGVLAVADDETIQGGPTNGVIRATGVVEKPVAAEAPSRFCIIGRYVLPAETFSIISATSEGVGGEIQLTDALDALARGPGLYGCVHTGHRYDVGRKLEYLRATVGLALDHPELGEDFAVLLHQIMHDRGLT